MNLAKREVESLFDYLDKFSWKLKPSTFGWVETDLLEVFLFGVTVLKLTRSGLSLKQQAEVTSLAKTT